jgi:hypothetical protein
MDFVLQWPLMLIQFEEQRTNDPRYEGSSPATAGTRLKQQEGILFNHQGWYSDLKNKGLRTNDPKFNGSSQAATTGMGKNVTLF